MEPVPQRVERLTAHESSAVRSALMTRFLAPVRNRRRFEVELWDPTHPGEPFDPDRFQEAFRNTLQPIFRLVDRCEVSISPVDPRAPDWLRNRFEERWRRAGARPADWIARYVQQAGNTQRIQFSEDVLDDWLFWWWAITQ